VSSDLSQRLGLQNSIRTIGSAEDIS